MKHLHIWRLVILSHVFFFSDFPSLRSSPFYLVPLTDRCSNVDGKVCDFHHVLSPLSFYHLSKCGVSDSTWMSLHWHSQ